MMLKSYFQNKIHEAGCDEVGRGSIAGPVVAAAVILPKGYKNDDWEVIYDPVNKIKKSFKSKSNEKKDKLLQGVCLIED